MKKVSVIIASYNKKDMLRECILAVKKQDYKSLETIIIDNDSTDGTSRMIEAEFPEVKVIRNEENLLFCKAQNQGINASSGEYVLSLNNDVRLMPDFISKMVDASERNPKIGALCGKILSDDGGKIDSAGQLLGKSLRPVDRGYGKPDKGQYNKSCYIFSTPGSAPFFKRKMLEDIRIDGQYFDEDYGMYYEDLDICWRAKKAGWKGYYLPGAVAYHLRAGSAVGYRKNWGLFGKRIFPLLPPDMKLRLLKNRYRTILKNASFFGFIIRLPFIIAYDAAIWIYIAFTSPSIILKFFKFPFRGHNT
jgi:GT2 family glycosyltransferase